MSDDPLIAAIRASTQAIGAAADALQADFAPDDRVARVLARLDACVSTMSPRARRTFLRAAMDGWERRYAEFVCCAGEADPAGPDASDYLLTICGISQRLTALDQCTERSNEKLDGNDDLKFLSNMEA